jgi:excisionase family DNA binding protein
VVLLGGVGADFFEADFITFYFRRSHGRHDVLMESCHDTPLLPAARTTLRTVDETAAYLHVSRRQVYKLVRASELRAVRVGHRLRFRPCDVEDYLERHLEPVASP